MRTSRRLHDTRLKENVSSIKQICFFWESWSETLLWFLLILFHRFVFLTLYVHSFFRRFLSFWRFIFHIFNVSFKKHRLISFSASSIHESFRVSFIRVWILSVSVSLLLFSGLVFLIDFRRILLCLLLVWTIGLICVFYDRKWSSVILNRDESRWFSCYVFRVMYMFPAISVHDINIVPTSLSQISSANSLDE